MAVSSSSSTVPAAKPPALSYAERARRAGASSTSHVLPRARATGPNGKSRSGDESTSSASSSRNLTPNSSAALTLPGSPPPSSSQTSAEEQQQDFPPMQKSPSKPPPPNVWTTRKEQMARTTVQQHQQHASASVPSENASQNPPAAINRVPINGTSAPQPSEDPSSEEYDPFVVHIPPHGHARPSMSSTSHSPPSLDDAENWPEMSKGAPSTSTSVSGSVVDMDKKDGPAKKGEKPKWIQITPAELKATHDALTAQSAANSRAQSQHRRGNQAKSRSRQQSQARPSHNGSRSQNRNKNQVQNYAASLSNGSSGGSRPGDTSAAQSRAESTTHSRTTSVHSSPHFPTRGRRLPEDPPFSVSMTTNAHAGPSTSTRRLPNGVPVAEEPSFAPQPSEIQDGPPAQRVYQDSSLSFTAPQPHSGSHSRTHTPYSHSPVYYPPPPSSGAQSYGYGPIPHSGGYAPPPAPSPGSGGTAMQQQGFIGYAPYGIPQHLPLGQPTFPYMYHPAPFPYYSASIPDQQSEVQPSQQQQPESAQQNESGAPYLSPGMPPASTITRPPPPEESGPLSGYRVMAPVSVSPLLALSVPRQSISEVVERGGEMVFGSVGQPGGMKSPSPALVVPSIDCEERDHKKTQTAFAVGFEGSATIRVKRSASGKDGVEEVAETIKIIDLTDKGSKWEFGTSALSDAPNERDEQERRSYEQDQGVQQQMDSQILQPQPHHMMHYPPPNVPPTSQVGGYNIGQQMHLHVLGMPMPSQSPQNNIQPLPSHVPTLAPLPLSTGFVSPLALNSPGPGPQSSNPVPVPMPGMAGGDEWEVRDFGYGFGPMSGSGYIPDRFRDDRYERESYRDPRDNYREPRDFGGPGGGSGFVPGRMRRSSTTGGYGSGYFEGGRGGFGGRRGRGQTGFGRGFSRGGFGGRGGHGNFQRHQPSLSVSTGPFHHQANMQQQQHHQQISPDVPNPNGYLMSPTTAASQYIPSPYGQFNPAFPHAQSQPQQPQPQPQPHQLPPVPIPVTALSFPLDPTRLYLLGQLEYYFSLQNLASDFFLRKQMDSRGWIPIHLIASFNRVRQLTQDPQLVKEVLSISSLVEVRDDHVRLSNRQWANFVLPSAAASTVEGEEIGTIYCASGEEAEKEAEEVEEDDVVFILGGEESRPWTGAN